MRIGKELENRTDSYYKVDSGGRSFFFCTIDPDGTTYDRFFVFVPTFELSFSHWLELEGDSHATNGHYEIFYLLEDVYSFIASQSEERATAFIKKFL